jgi:hypothetical protein
VKGACRYTFEGEFTVRGGDIVELQDESCRLDVLGDDELELVLCWELPFEFDRIQ